MTRIEREKLIVRKMIELYCRHHLKQNTLPDDYNHLAEYACNRLDQCKYGEKKAACKFCPTHCYAPKERQQIRELMRWVGPRMIWYAPKDTFIYFFYKFKYWLQSLSFRTGVIVLLCCIPFYILSFAQMLLPISITAKGILWTILFGLAKTCQYGGLTILGVEGYKRLKRKFKRKNGKSTSQIS